LKGRARTPVKPFARVLWDGRDWPKAVRPSQGKQYGKADIATDKSGRNNRP